MMRRELGSLITVVVLFVFFGCGSNPAIETYTVPPIVVSVTSSATSAEARQTVTVTATVTNSANQNVTWQVNGKPGGDATCGTISNGLYSAPDTVSAPMQVTVTAIAQADPTKSASVVLNIGPELKLIIEPSIATIPAGATQKFTAKLSDGTTPALTWMSYGGSITADGEYTAPIAIGSASVQAVTTGSTSRSASLQLKVVYSKAVLKGKYVFAYDGLSGATHVAMAGMFTADGSGNLEAAVLDRVSPASVERDVPFTASYTVNEDGLGEMTLDLPGAVQHTWHIAISPLGTIAFAELSAQSPGSGIIEPQVANSAIRSEGLYLLSSSPAPRGPAMAGYIDLEQVPNSGAYDLKGAQQAIIHQDFTTSYSFDDPRRVLVSLKDSTGTREYRAYLVNSSTFYAVSLDTSADVLLRGNAASKEPFAESMPGFSYVLHGAGSSASGTSAIAGGGIVFSQGNIAAGSLDTNDAGTVSSWDAAAGTYTAGPGRAEMHVITPAGTLDLITYAGSEAVAFISADPATQLAGWIEMAEINPFGIKPPCYETSAFSSMNIGPSPSLGVGRLAIAETAEGSSIVNIFQNGSALLNQAVIATVDAPASGSRYLLKFNGPVTRTYAVYNCRAVSIDPQWPEAGILLGLPAWSWFDYGGPIWMGPIGGW